MTLQLERSQIVQEVQQWLEQVVIGLNLCPFAAEPLHKEQVRIRVSDAETEDALLTDVQAELMLLNRMHPSELETTLLVSPLLLTDFEQYNDFLYLVNLLLKEFDWEGQYQVASFHPHYRFAGTDNGAVENLTNRSPYPILHILRETSVSHAVATHPDTEQIPTRNIQKVQSLSPSDKASLFPYL